MTDPEVSTILAETDDAKRKKNFDDFYDNRLREAIREMIKEIETSVREQSEAIEREIQNRINELNNNMAQETRAFEEIKYRQVRRHGNFDVGQRKYSDYALPALHKLEDAIDLLNFNS